MYNMKKLRKIILPVLGVLLAAALFTLSAVLAVKIYNDHKRAKEFEALPAAVLHGYEAPAVDYGAEALQYFVYDLTDNEYVSICGRQKVIYPASTTKLLTALVALEYLEPDEVVTAGDEADFIEYGSSIAYIQKDMRLSVEMLIEGMLLPSGNDAAYVLAAAAGRKIAGSDNIDSKQAVGFFVDEMNVFAKKNGLCGSNFVTPDGYCGSEHYSTLEDMMLISKMASENEIIRKYAAMESDYVTYASGETNTWKNTNECLDKSSKYYNEHITGLKTGSLDEYNNFIAIYESGGKEYLIGVFGLEDKEQRFADVNTISAKLQ